MLHNLNIIVYLNIVLQFWVPLVCAKDVIFDFTVSYADRYPDGVKKQVIVINDVFPGPTIRAKIHDTLIVRITNQLRDKDNATYPTSVHWHGIEMFRKPWWDGPDGITQCAIPYGKSMQYKFTLDQAGTYWYHSHHNWQYVDGFWGILIIDNTKELYAGAYAGELVVPLSDWHHTPSRRLASCYANLVTGPPVPDSGLINGLGSYPCTLPKTISNAGCPECDPGSLYPSLPPAPPNCAYVCDPRKQATPVYNVIRGVTYRIRVINTSARSNFIFSIDGHKLTVIATDGVDTIPVGPVDSVMIWPAQRYSFLVTMDGSEGVNNFWIRGDMSFLAPGVPQPKAILRYKEANGNSVPPKSIAKAYAVKGASQGRPATHDFDWTRYNGTSASPPEDADFIFPIAAAAQRSGGGRPENQTGGHHNSVVGVMKLNPAVANRQASQQMPTTLPTPNPVYLDQSLCTPFPTNGYASALAPASYQQEITINANLVTYPNYTQGQINGLSYMPNSGLPMILQMRQNLTICPRCNPLFIPMFKKVVQVVINNHHIASHPWHLHGHTFWVLGTGDAQAGDYVESRDGPKLKLNGVRRDTTHTNSQSWTVIRYVADNPGAWLFHCHINWHLDIGLAAVFVEGESELRQQLAVPGETKRVCGYNGIKA